MKKILLLCLCLAMQSLAFATNRVTTHEEELPAPALEFISTYFKDQKVEKVTLLKKKKMDVQLSDTTHVHFDKKGGWYMVRHQHKGVPQAIVPEKIRQQIAVKYPEKNIKYLRVRVEKGMYSVTLSNKHTLRFDKDMKCYADVKAPTINVTVNGVKKEMEGSVFSITTTDSTKTVIQF